MIHVDTFHGNREFVQGNPHFPTLTTDTQLEPFGSSRGFYTKRVCNREFVETSRGESLKGP